jgi:hypothetical protein
VKIIIALAALLTALTLKTFAGTFSDDLSSGLNPAYWSIVDSTPGVYSVNPTSGGIALAKTGTTSGNQLVNVVLNMAAIGGNISGDFSEQIDFANAVIGPLPEDQVQLDDSFADDSLFSDVYDRESGLNVHVYTASPQNINGSVNNPISETSTSGTFTISRTGSTVTGSFDGTPIYSESDSSALTYVDFRLETQGSPNNDSPSVTFDNFSITASSVPEPAAMSLWALCGLACLFCLKRG